MLLLGSNPKKTKTNPKRHMDPIVHYSTIYNSHNIEATEVPIQTWKDKENVVYSYSRKLLIHIKEWSLATCGNMDGPGGYYAKWNKPDREKQTTYDFTHAWNLKNKMYEWVVTKQKQTQSNENKSVATRGERNGWEDRWRGWKGTTY